MREIKFRAWDKDDKIMRNWRDLIFEKDKGNDFYAIGHHTSPAVIDYYNEHVLMQYTGLKDKNGKEIYEGDILKRIVTVVVYGSGRPAEDVEEFLEVEYNTEYAGFFIGETQLFAYVRATRDIHTRCSCTDVEVIGNIYGNPELLEVE